MCTIEALQTEKQRITTERVHQLNFHFAYYIPVNCFVYVCDFSVGGRFCLRLTHCWFKSSLRFFPVFTSSNFAMFYWIMRWEFKFRPYLFVLPKNVHFFSFSIPEMAQAMARRHNIFACQLFFPCRNFCTLFHSCRCCCCFSFVSILF